jgi:vacuolar iron transporter family protein
MRRRSLPSDYLRSALFGVEDSLVSTTGVIAGVGVGSSSEKVVLLAGFVALAVEALSMAAGEYLSERTLHQANSRHAGKPLVGSLIMLVSYFMAGLLPLLAVVTLPLPESIVASVAIALAGLFLLGAIKSRFVKINWFKSGLEVLAVGGIATLIGVAAGAFLRV